MAGRPADSGVAIHSEVLSPTHLNTGIAHLRLGRALLRQRRYDEAETHLRTGQAIVEKESGPSSRRVVLAKDDLDAVASAREKDAVVRR